MKMFRLVIAVFMLFICLGLVAEANPLPLTEVAPQDFSPLSEADLAQLQEMLAEADLQIQSLNFEKDWDLSTRQKSSWHLNSLQNPLTGIMQVGELRRICAEQNDTVIAEMLNHFAYIAWDKPDAIEVYAQAYFAYLDAFEAKVQKPKDLFTFWDNVLNGLEGDINATYAQLSPSRLDSLTAFCYGAFVESEDKDKYEQFFKKNALPKTDNLEADALDKLLNAVDTDVLYETALRYYAATQVMRKGAAKLMYTNKKAMVKSTTHGVMIIGTVVDDLYDKYEFKELANSPLCLLIEPAGNDTYEMALNTGRKHATYLLIDYSGNDVYRSKEPAEMFFSICGHGISYDIKGDDTYLNDDFAFSSLLGTNIHIDYAGTDFYHSGLFSQGAALQGISLLVDYAGNDVYTATTMAQGMGSVRGVGALLDYAGSDTYQLGGKYFHAPLMPNDYRSMGQGMGFGMRSDFAGGLGLLYDKTGNDKYLGGVYAQGVGYWYATGVLIDEAGNDVYNAIYYPQGSGIHLAGGFLYDGGGDDAYYSRNGPGQGAGHDWGLGVLIDSSGNDAYSIQGGNGLGLSNSVGIFVDKMGDDRYERNETQNYGSGAFSRSTGSIGLFLDEGGKDSYPDSTRTNNNTWKKGSYGIGRDVELNAPAPAPSPEVAGDDPLVAEDAPIAEVFAAASEWEVGSAIQRVREARKVLISRREESQSYILQNKLNSKSGLEYRALQAFLKDNDNFKLALYDHVYDADSLKAKMSLSLISETGDSLLIIPIRKYLAENKYITACLSLLGSINSEESISILSQYAFHSSERYRYIVARSLRQIATPAAYSALDSMKEDDSFLVQALIRNLPEVKP